jgi:hypothetical protein
MPTEALYFSGVNGASGEWLLTPRTADQVAKTILEGVNA